MPLKLGMFLTPASHPQRPMSEVIDWNIDVIRMAERYSYDEVWVGSHLTSHYSRIACPIQVIARAIDETSKIMLGTGVTVLYKSQRSLPSSTTWRGGGSTSASVLARP